MLCAGLVAAEAAFNVIRMAARVWEASQGFSLAAEEVGPVCCASAAMTTRDGLNWAGPGYGVSHVSLWAAVVHVGAWSSVRGNGWLDALGPGCVPGACLGDSKLWAQ